MKHNDTQSGSPEIIYKDTKANIEAIAAPVEGMKAYATDTHLEGVYNGTAWKWIGAPALLGNGASQYQTIITGATPFVPVYSGFLLDGTTGGKTVFAVTSGKTLTLTAVDNFNLTIPATGTAALLNQANSFTLINPLTTIAESWIGPSATAGIYFKGNTFGFNTASPLSNIRISVNGGIANQSGGFSAYADATIKEIIFTSNTYYDQNLAGFHVYDSTISSFWVDLFNYKTSESMSAINFNYRAPDAAVDAFTTIVKINPTGLAVIVGSVSIGGAGTTAKLNVSGLVDYANNAAAVTGGLTAGAFYTVTGSNPKQVAVVY